ADRSFISTAFSSLIDIVPTPLGNSYDVELADDKIVGVDTIMRGCTLDFLNHPFNIDLMPVELGSFDVIIGMDWLRRCHTMIVCDGKLVQIPYGNETLNFRSNESNNGREYRLTVISCSKAQEYMEKRFIRDYPEVFPKDLPGLPPARPVEFQIDLIPRAAYVARAPYRLAPSKMKELSEQLQELSEKGFIRPSFRYEVGESSAVRPTEGQGVDYGFVNTLDAEARGRGIGEVGLSQTVHSELQNHQEQVYAHEFQLQTHQARLQLQSTLIQTQHQLYETRFQMQQAEIAELRETDRRRQAQMAETLRVMGDMRREMDDMQFVTDETEKIDKYVSGLPDNIYRSVKASKPKTLDETIELANDLMDQKLRTYAERQSNNKRKAEESYRNNLGHQQQAPKRQNVNNVMKNFSICIIQIMKPVTRQGPSTIPNNTNPNKHTPESVQAMIDQAFL
nr:putative reverse transcriptase domain-containing protein [Tanacetum cinerariifolium]